jgi:hypothetical protein
VCSDPDWQEKEANLPDGMLIGSMPRRMHNMDKKRIVLSKRPSNISNNTAEPVVKLAIDPKIKNKSGRHGSPRKVRYKNSVST